MDADGIDEVAEAGTRSSSTKGNPVPVTAADLADILRHSL